MNYNVNFNDFFGVASILFMFFAFVVILIFIALWIFSGFGIRIFAKKKNLKNTWLAFIPVGRNYLIAKLGFEEYLPSTKKNPTLTWITLGISAACVLFSDESFYQLLNIALTVFQTIAFYNIYKCVSKKTTVMTIFTALFGNLIGGIFLYAIKNNKEIIVLSNEENVDLSKDEEKKEEVKKEEVKNESVNANEEKTRPNFCPSCGSKLNKTSKFCGNCGNKID